MFEYLRMLPANRGMLVLSYHFIWLSLENERCGYKTKRGVTQWYLQNDEPESTLVTCRAVNAMHLVVPSSPSCTVLVILPSRCMMVLNVWWYLQFLRVSLHSLESIKNTRIRTHMTEYERKTIFIQTSWIK